MISFDVTNCFPNISTELALQTTENAFDRNMNKNTKIPKSYLQRFWLIDCNYFCYNNMFI